MGRCNQSFIFHQLPSTVTRHIILLVKLRSKLHGTSCCMRSGPTQCINTWYSSVIALIQRHHLHVMPTPSGPCPLSGIPISCSSLVQAGHLLAHSKECSFCRRMQAALILTQHRASSSGLTRACANEQNKQQRQLGG